MMKKEKSSAGKIALAGMLAALGVVILFAGYATGIMDLTALAVSSVLTAIAVVELGGAYPYLVWAVTGVLAFILIPGPLAAEYVIFGGIYPMLKIHFERFGRILEWVAKLTYGAVVLGVMYLLSRFIFGDLEETGLLLVALGVGYAVFFVVYDYALSVAMTVYMRRLRPKLTFLKRL